MVPLSLPIGQGIRHVDMMTDFSMVISVLHVFNLSLVVVVFNTSFVSRFVMRVGVSHGQRK